jgi:predicted dehydrogenase/threonine dehydrogenase-like Zn-dependent dehydrogenase
VKQVVLDQSSGDIDVVDVPRPALGTHGLLISLRASVISSGTERAKLEMGGKSILAKAKARPDLTKKVIDQVRKDGVRDTLAVVRDRLGTPQPLGYSACGEVVEVGSAVSGFVPGQLVACAGAGYANHAEMVCVPGNLCAPVPDGVRPEDAAFATVASIALHGIRQARLTAGELVVVSGLGLIGQLAVRILLAYGHPVIGVDLSSHAREEVAALGVTTLGPDDPQLFDLEADAVLLCASTESNAPVTQAPTWCRDRGRIVVVGDVGLHLTRAPYYENEIDLYFSRSYGPGRYDPRYEEGGADYPIGYVRWTEGRNLAEVLRLLSIGRLDVHDLITERFPIARAAEAFAKLSDGSRVRGLIIDYPHQTPADGPIVLRPTPIPGTRQGRLTVGVCGAGNFARKTLLPALESTGRVQWGSIATATGITARHVGLTKGFQRALSDGSAVVTDEANDAVLIATRHDSHAALVAAAVEAGKHVYVEKPLAVTPLELEQLENLGDGVGKVVTGFNRRFAAATVAVRDRLRPRTGALVLDVRVNAGRLPAHHWSDSADQGGRIIGEACHFVDLACSLAGSPVSRVTARGSGRRSPEVEDTVQCLMEFADGSTATLAYLANGARGVPKERVEAHWDGCSALIDDFRSWSFWQGDRETKGGSKRQDKGHQALVSAFVRTALHGGQSPVPFHQAAHVTRVTFAIVESLRHGGPVDVGSVAW